MILIAFTRTYRKRLNMFDRFKDIASHLHMIVPLSIIFAKFDLRPFIGSKCINIYRLTKLAFSLSFVKFVCNLKYVQSKFKSDCRK